MLCRSSAAGTPSRSGEELSKAFEPDPSFRLSSDVRARILPWYDPDALEYLLSAFPADSRESMLELFCSLPGQANYTIPQFSGPGVQDPEFAAALRTVFAPLYLHNPDMVDRYPFDMTRPDSK